MKTGPEYSTLAARPGLVAELDSHASGRDADLRRAAEVAFGRVDAELREVFSASLTAPATDRWDRLKACDSIAGAPTEALLKRLQADPRLSPDLRAAAQETLAALAERGRLGVAAGMSQGASRSRSIEAADGPGADTASLVSMGETPAEAESERRAWRPWRRNSRAMNHEPPITDSEPRAWWQLWRR